MLSFLALAPDRSASRDEIATLLWGDCSNQQARQSLRQALALIRKELGAPDLLLATSDTARIDEARWSVDVWEFQRLAQSRDPDDLIQAARLFAGEFLAGLNIEEEGFVEWVRRQRQRLQNLYGEVCAGLAASPDGAVSGREAIDAVDQLVGLDPLREDWHRIALTCYARYRNRSEALGLAAKLAEQLKRELGVELERETADLVARIRDDAPQAPDRINRTVEPTETGPVDADVSVPDSIALPRQEAADDSGSASPGVTAQADRERSNGRRSGQRAVRIAAAFVVLTALVLAVVMLTPVRQIYQHWAAASTPSGNDSWQSPASAQQSLPNGIVPIVILPFTVFGSDESLQLTADMLSDDLTNILSRIPSFRVINRQTARGYQGPSVDVARIGEELHVRYILEGSIRRQDDKLRVNVDLINPATRLTLWSERVDRDGGDRQGVRDEIVSLLAHELQVQVMPIESLRLDKDEDAGALAYRGWAAMNQISPNAYQQALALFEQALKKDPNDLSAQIGVGAYHARMGAQVVDDDQYGHRDKAIEILRKVLRQDPYSSAAHYYLGLALNKLPTLPEAMEHLHRSIEINPSEAGGYAQIGNGLIRSGKPSEGLDYVRYAIRLSPRDPTMPVWLEFAGNAQLELNNYADAIDYFKRSITLSPSYRRGWAGLAAAYALAGRMSDADTASAQLKSFAPDLDRDAIVRQYGRHPGSKLRQGLQLAFSGQR